MKKVLLSLAVAAFLASCGGTETTETSALDALKNAAEDAAETVKTEVEETAKEVKEETPIVEAPADTSAEVEVELPADSSEVDAE
jgi:hypothetical protein